MSNIKQIILDTTNTALREFVPMAHEQDYNSDSGSLPKIFSASLINAALVQTITPLTREIEIIGGEICGLISVLFKYYGTENRLDDSPRSVQQAVGAYLLRVLSSDSVKNDNDKIELPHCDPATASSVLKALAQDLKLNDAEVHLDSPELEKEENCDVKPSEKKWEKVVAHAILNGNVSTVIEHIKLFDPKSPILGALRERYEVVSSTLDPNTPKSMAELLDRGSQSILVTHLFYYLEEVLYKLYPNEAFEFCKDKGPILAFLYKAAAASVRVLNDTGSLLVKDIDQTKEVVRNLIAKYPESQNFLDLLGKLSLDTVIPDEKLWVLGRLVRDRHNGDFSENFFLGATIESDQLLDKKLAQSLAQLTKGESDPIMLEFLQRYWRAKHLFEVISFEHNAPAFERLRQTDLGKRIFQAVKNFYEMHKDIYATMRDYR